MLTVILPPEVTAVIHAALRKAKHREIGGILMAEHIGHNKFEVRDLTVHRHGAFASFVRRIEDAVGRLRLFFDRSEHDYARFNYLGEWHSHPSFEPMPSMKDDTSMFQIVQDSEVGANFAVLLIVKLDLSGQLIGSAHTYLPNGTKAGSVIRFKS
jgi:hypothetical protein